MAAAVLTVAAVSCEKHPKMPEEQWSDAAERQYLNYYAKNFIGQYYLWTEEIGDKIDNWDMDGDPVFNVKDARYTLEDGTLVDRWTALYENISTMTNQLSGDYKSYGMEYRLFYTDSDHKGIVAIVTYVYAGSPAEKAGIRRGDVVLKVNGRQMDVENYVEIVEKEIDASDNITLTLNGREGDVRMTAVDMYMDPVLCYKVFGFDGKKVGYLAYMSFNAASCEKLIEVCKYFKSEGVTELILDLRYNGGGLVLAHETLASMLAPESAVQAGDIYTTEVYNKEMSEYYDETVLFTDSFSYESNGKRYEYSTASANVPLTKIYVLMTRSTASASEALVTGLKPYIDIEMIGEQSHGKYCGGVIMSADKWYDSVRSKIAKKDYDNGKKYAGDWGVYVMISRYADKFGKTPCMPSGFVPDVAVADNPTDGFQLGDPQETMLNAALVRAGYPVAIVETKSKSVKNYEMAPYQGKELFLAVHE